MADFKHTYDRLTEGFRDHIRQDFVVSLERDANGNWRIGTRSGTLYEARTVVLAIPYHNAVRVYPVPKPYLPTSATVLHVVGERHARYRGKRFILFHPEETGIALMWQQVCGTDLIFSLKPDPNLDAFYRKCDIVSKVSWKTAVVISDGNWVSLRLEQDLYLVGDYNVCGLKDSFLTGLCAGNAILSSSTALGKAS